MSKKSKDGKIEFELETVALAELHPHPRNYRVHPEDQIAHIIESIREHGFYRNIVIACEGTVLAGHGVVEASREMGFGSVPVVRLDVEPDDPLALKVLVGDNEIEHLGEVDDRALTEILKEIKLSDENGLVGTGYDEQMLANLVFVTRSVDEIQDFDAAAEWVGMPDYKQSPNIFKIIINFKSEADREKLMEQIGMESMIAKGRLTWSCWWPEKERGDLLSVRWEGEDGS